MKVKQNIILILILLLIGCQTYEERWFEQEYDGSEAKIVNSKDHFYTIDGIRQRVKTEDFDQNDVLRKEVFFRDKLVYKINSSPILIEWDLKIYENEYLPFCM